MGKIKADHNILGNAFVSILQTNLESVVSRRVDKISTILDREAVEKSSPNRAFSRWA